MDILKALNEATNSAGGYTVPTELADRLLALIQRENVFITDLDQQRMNSLTKEIPKVTSGTTARWPGEIGTITGSESGFGQTTLTAKKLAGLTQVSTEVLEDSIVDLGSQITEQLSTDMSLELEDKMVNGTGTIFTGLRNTASFTNAVSAKGDNTSATGADGTGSTVTGANISLKPIVQAVTEVLKDNHAQPDVSYWNPRTIGSIKLLTDGNARPMLDETTYGSPLVKEGVLGILYGTKAKSTTVLPITLTYGTGTTSATDAIVARAGKYAYLGNRRGMKFTSDYDIDNDSWKYQATARFGFAIKYADAYCVIRAILD